MLDSTDTEIFRMFIPWCLVRPGFMEEKKNFGRKEYYVSGVAAMKPTLFSSTPSLFPCGQELASSATFLVHPTLRQVIYQSTNNPAISR